MDLQCLQRAVGFFCKILSSSLHSHLRRPINPCKKFESFWSCLCISTPLHHNGWCWSASQSSFRNSMAHSIDDWSYAKWNFSFSFNTSLHQNERDGRWGEKENTWEFGFCSSFWWFAYITNFWHFTKYRLRRHGLIFITNMAEPPD